MHNKSHLVPGEFIRLRSNARLMSVYRGSGVVISQIGDSVRFKKQDGGNAEALRYQVTRVRNAAQ